jgi:hypothetical protein
MWEEYLYVKHVFAMQNVSSMKLANASNQPGLTAIARRSGLHGTALNSTIQPLERAE